jgi:hypothetical protein
MQQSHTVYLSTPSQKRAMDTLKRKKMYESQRDQLAGQQFNIEQTSFTIDSIKDTQVSFTNHLQAVVLISRVSCYAQLLVVLEQLQSDQSLHGLNHLHILMQTTVAAMKAASKEIKTEFKKMNLNEIEVNTLAC